MVSTTYGPGIRIESPQPNKSYCNWFWVVQNVAFQSIVRRISAVTVYFLETFIAFSLSSVCYGNKNSIGKRKILTVPTNS